MSDVTPSNRSRPRVEVRFRAEYSGRRISGSGTVHNISETGALIEYAEPLIMEGGRIRLRFSFYEDSLPVDIPALVVRETEGGFAVRFSDLDPRTRTLLRVALRRAAVRAREIEADEDDSTLTSLF